MNNREFMAHCICDWRYKELQKTIESGPIEKVHELQQLNNTVRTFRRTELNELLRKRLQ